MVITTDKIKILFFIQCLSYKGSLGGAEKVLITLVNNMDKSRFDITVQTLFPDPFSASLCKDVKYKYCYPSNNAITELVYRVEAQLGMVYPLYIKDDYDIEVAYLECDATKVIAASTNKKARKIAWVHKDFETGLSDKQRFVRKTEGKYKKFDKVVCVSNKCKQSFDTLFSHRFDSMVIYNAIDENEIRQKADNVTSTIKKRKYTICTVGRFSPQKNYPRLLKTCKKLVREGYDFDLWIIGDGILRPQIEKYIRENDLEAVVTLFGFQSNPYPYMKEADLLICSSDFEGFSTFVAEGVILGKPVFTTECSGMHELLDDYDGGTIVKNNDDAFCSGLREYLRNNKKQEIYVHHAFSLEKLVKANEELFESILTGNA